MDYVHNFEMAYDVDALLDKVFYQDVYLGHLDDFAAELGITREQVYAAILAIEKAYNLIIELDNRNQVVVMN